MRKRILASLLFVVVALGNGPQARAQPLFNKTVYGSQTAYTNSLDGTRFWVPNSWLPGTQYYNNAQIAQIDMSSRNPGAAEVQTFLSNPGAWRANMMAHGTYELGVPTRLAYFRNGMVVEAWSKIGVPNTANMHYFTVSGMPAGYTALNYQSNTFLYQVWVPKKLPLPKSFTTPPGAFAGFKR